MPVLRAEEISYTRVQQLERERSITFVSASAIEAPFRPL